MTNSRTKLRPDIQALRAIAVLSVVIYHLSPKILVGGFMGVDVFFVISGYLMTYTISKSINTYNSKIIYESPIWKTQNYAIFLIEFYAKRIKRLLPAAFVVIAFVLLIVSIFGSVEIQLETIKQIYASLLIHQNLYLANQGIDYLGSDAKPTAVQHFWSLSLEEQFYLFWPIMLLMLSKTWLPLTRHSFIKKCEVQNPQKKAELFVILAITILSFLYCLKCTYSISKQVYFLTAARIWELSLGGVIHFLPVLKNRKLSLVLPWLGIGLIFYSFLNWSGNFFPGWHALLPTFGTALVIWCGITTDDNISDYHVRDFKVSLMNLSRFRPLQFFGNVSYSLYLWHWPIIVLMPLIFDFSAASKNNTLEYKYYFIFIVSTFAAWLSYIYVEQPFKNMRSGRFASKKIWACAGVLIIILLGSSQIIEFRTRDFAANVVQQAFKRSLDQDDKTFGAKAIDYFNKFSDSDSPFGTVDHKWAQFYSIHVHGTINSRDKGVDLSASCTYSCAINSKSKTNVICEFGDINSTKTLLVLGDSYSKHWYPAIDVAARKIGYKVIAANSIFSNGSLFEIGNEFGDEWTYQSGARISVTRSNERFNWIRHSLWPSADAVIISVSPSCFSRLGKNPQQLVDAPQRLASTFENIKEITGKKPILIQSPPSAEGWNENSPVYSAKVIKNPSKRMNLIYESLSEISKLDTFKYLKIEGIFLDKNGDAHTHIGGLPVFFDGGHICTLYSASAGSYFADQLSVLLDE